MKKIGYTFIIALLYFFVQFSFPSIVKGATNQFSCEWNGVACDVGGNDCSAGFAPNDETCQSIADFGECQGTINQTCVSTTPPGTRYTCRGPSVGCIPDASGLYGDINSCSAACSGSVPAKFSCITGQCVEDPNGNYDSITGCTAVCSSGGIGEDNQPTFGCPDDSINTAIGCIPALADDNGVSFMGFILKWAVGVGSGVAFLLILYSGFMIMTSAGNPERLKAGQELLTGAISGLILLIFSIFILKFIGIDILELDNFGFGQ